MKIVKTLHFQAILLSILAIGSSLAMEGGKSQKELLDELRKIFARECHLRNAGDQEGWERLERLRLSGIRQGLREWQEPAFEMPCQLEAKGLKTFNFDAPFSDIAIVPYTTSILASSCQTLHRIDALTGAAQQVTFESPINNLVQSADGSMCAVLLMAKDSVALARFVNSSKSILEINTDIEPIPYHFTNDYELAQEADLSYDARFLATVSSPNSVCIHSLKENSPHAIITKKESEFPIFSVHFLKPANSCHPEEKHILAVQGNMHTGIYEINETGKTELYSIAQKTLFKNLDYSPRQSAWIFSDGIIVRVSNKLFVFNNKNELIHTFIVGINSDISLCNENARCFLEPRKKEKEIRFHRGIEKVSVKFNNPSNHKFLIADSAKLFALSVDKALLCAPKPETTEENKK